MSPALAPRTPDRKSPLPAAAATEPRSSRLRVGPPSDAFEREADRAADAVASNANALDWPLARVRFGQIQRQPAPDAPTNQAPPANQPATQPQPNNYKEGATKLGEAFLQTDIGKKLKDAAGQDPLVKGAEDFFGTLPGKIIAGTAAAGAVSALAATHKALPAQIPEIPLDAVRPGLKVKIDYEGSVDHPTKAIITFSHTPQGDKKKPVQTDSERYRAETAHIAADQDKFRAGLKYAPGTPEAKQQEADQKTMDDYLTRKLGTLPGTGGRPLVPAPSASGQSSGSQWSFSPLAQPDQDEKLEPATSSAPSGTLQRKCACQENGAGGECEECKNKSGTLQRKAAGQTELDAAPPVVDQVLSSSGRPLDKATRDYFEPRFGYDFGKVRVHTDAQAAESARAVSALAYTVGDGIAFAEGQYSPQGTDGRRLLAHELAHTVQQGQAPARGLQGNGSNADTANPAAARSAPVLSRAGHSVQRVVADEVAAEAPKTATRLSPEEMIKEVLKQRGWTNRAPQPYLPEGERGGDLGHGMDTHAILQVTDKDGKVAAQELGGHLIGDKSIEKSARELLPKEVGEKGKVHGERMALERVKVRLADVDVRGGTMEVAVDALPCGPEKKNCLGNLVDYAESKGLKPKAYVPDEFGHQAPGSAAAAAPEALERQFRVYGTKGAARRATRDPAAAGEASETGSVKVLQVWPPGETYEPVVRGGAGKVPGLAGELRGTGDAIPKVNPIESEAKAGLPEALGERGLGRSAGAAGAELEGLGAGALAEGSIAETALAGAASIAIDLVLLVGMVVWELVIAPKIEKMIQEIQDARRKQMQQKIQEKFNFYAAKHVERIVSACYLPRLREIEKAGGTAYVNVAINVVFQDTSTHPFGELFGPNPPESIFDIEVYDVALADATVSQTKQSPSVGPMTRCENCGFLGRDKSFMSNDPLWSQKVSFSFEAPRAADLAKDLPKDVKEDSLVHCAANLACFIATACYGSVWAPEVESLRQFRDAFLMRCGLGRQFVAAYYRLSPSVAEWLRTKPIARKIVRLCLVRPLVRLVRGLGLDRGRFTDAIAGHPSKTGGYS